MSYKAEHLLTEMRKASDALHLKFIGPPDFLPTWGSLSPELDGMVSIRGTQIRLDSHSYKFEFRDVDARVTSFQNLLADKFPENQVYYDPPDKPEWTAEHAVEVATVFERIFVDPTNTLLGAPRAKYVHTIGKIVGDRTKMQLGMWLVSWPRIDSHGHPFYGDGLTVEIQEGFCPLGVGVNLSTPFDETTGEPVSANIALERAENSVFWEYLPERFFFDFAHTGDSDSRIIGYYVLGQRLSVVIPHWGNTRTARLAWEIWFRPRHPEPLVSHYHIDSEDFSVWVDAHTGSIIGGDAML